MWLKRLSKMVVAYNKEGNAVTAGELQATGAMALLLKDAIKPNLVQTLENTPAFIHGGPFANIAHGCNSVMATKIALKLADYVVTEAGFGADLGAEKFFDIKCRMGGLVPDTVVIVATIRALKYHGGADIKELSNENIPALKDGMENLDKHIENMQMFGLKPIVAINKFATDTPDEIKLITEHCKNKGVEVALNDAWAKGGEGAVELAEIVVKAVEDPGNKFKPLYDLSASYEEKIEIIAKNMYGADGVEYAAKATRQLKAINNLELDDLPVCIAKTQKSLSDNDKMRGRPRGYKISVREVELSSGAGFIVPIAGAIMRMPGLPSKPAAENIDIDRDGNITGLF